MNRIIIVDGNSLLFRAYFATSFNNQIMTTKSGIPTNAIFAFANMMSKIISTLKNDDKIFVSFDTGKKTFRHDALESYKAQRKPIDENLKIQLPIARELLKAMNVFYYELEGHEGDDIAGTVAKMASNNNYQVEIYTSDKDFLQLIDDNTKINLIRKGLSDIEVMDEAKLYEKMQLTPSQIRDYKGLTGDSSDNLKGIPGIGDKTAIKLINEYNTLEEIIKAHENIDSKLAQKIRDGKEEGILCKQLATIETDVPLNFNLDDLTYEGYDVDELSAFYTKYEFFSLIKKLKVTDKRITKKNKVLNTTIPSYTKHYVNSFKEIPTNIHSLIADIDGKNYSNINLKGLFFANDTDVFYLSYSKNMKDKELIEFFKNSINKISVYDSKSLKLALLKDGIEINNIDFDLLVASYIINSSIGNDCRTVFSFYGFNILENSSEIDLFDENPMFFNMAICLNSIKKVCINKLESINCLSLYNDIEFPLASVLAEMEYEGFPLNTKTLSEINNKYQLILDDVTSEIHSIAGDNNLNISSPKQIADLLFHKLNLPTNKKESTSIEVLTSIAHLHPIVPLIIKHRKYSKIISTYSSNLSDYVLSDGKIHACFNQTLTTTGRLSSSEPNLQNISIKSEEGKEIRKAFYYDDENIYLLSLDYSQIELRILSQLSNCTSLINAFKNDEDIHSETARKIFQIPDNEEVPTLLRSKAKTINFGIVYGISDWGLSEQLDITVTEAKKIIDAFFLHYPEINSYFKNIVEFAKSNNYVETLFHRRRYISELNSDNYQTREFGKRAAMNAPIQGTAADLIKLAMVKVNNALKENNYKSKIVSQIHDELILKVYSDEKNEIEKLVRNIMENVYDFDCPLKVDGQISKTWYEVK